jgi:hypothetical protein
VGLATGSGLAKRAADAVEKSIVRLNHTSQQARIGRGLEARPDDAQSAGMRLRLASNFLTIPAPSPCVFFENWTRSQAMWQSQHLPLSRGSF